MNYNELPVQPNGMPFSKDDYLALSKEYQEERKQVIRKYNLLQVFLILIGVICAAISIPVMITVSSGAGIALIVTGMIIMLFGASFKPKGDRKLTELQEKHYANYIRNFKN